jgi:hypothetical protein
MVTLWFDLRNDSLVLSQPVIDAEHPASIAEVKVAAPVSSKLLMRQITQLINQPGAGTIPLVVKVVIEPA